jgi:hypothetical protein
MVNPTRTLKLLESHGGLRTGVRFPIEPMRHQRPIVSPIFEDRRRADSLQNRIDAIVPSAGAPETDAAIHHPAAKITRGRP